MLRPPLKRMASSAALDDALDDGVSPVRCEQRQCLLRLDRLG